MSLANLPTSDPEGTASPLYFLQRTYGHDEGGTALTRLQLAELLLDHYPAEKKDVLEHLDFAIREFREMKMPTSLERTLRRAEILRV